jgi:hypothetical protein
MSDTETEAIVDAEPIAESIAEPVAEPIVDAEPIAESIAEPVAEPIAEPVAEPIATLEEEAVDGLPVLAEVRAIEPAPRQVLPAVQAAAAAATGFVAGAATVALVRRHGARKLARRGPGRRAVDLLPIVGSRTFLVDVHLIAKPGE